MDKNTRQVWEVKPNTDKYNERASLNSSRNGAVQLLKYIQASANTTRTYFPLIQGQTITPITINWSATEYLYARGGNNAGPLAAYQSGMIYYDTRSKGKTPQQPQPAVLPKVNENKSKQNVPDIQTVATAAGSVGAAYVIYRIGKAIIGLFLTHNTSNICILEKKLIMFYNNP